MSRELIIGTRGSALSLQQTQLVIDDLRRVHPGLEIVVRRIRSEGDRAYGVPLSQMGGRGVFVKEIEAALLAKDVDVAVHSLKDMPSESTWEWFYDNVQSDGGDMTSDKSSQAAPGLIIAAYTEREDPRDVLVTRHQCSLMELPAGAKLGTSSPRRAAQMRALRPDLQIVEIRGNVDTRLRKSDTDDYDAIVLAAAGLIRMSWENRVSQYFEPEECLPAVGQGAMAVQVREDDTEAIALVSAVDHGPTRAEVTAERAFLRALGGGCQVPFACLGQVRNGRLAVHGLVASYDGSRLVRAQAEGDPKDAQALGQALAEEVLRRGGTEIIQSEGSRE